MIRLAVFALLAGCGGGSRETSAGKQGPVNQVVVAATTDDHGDHAVRLPRAPGEHAPSLVSIERPMQESDLSDGVMLSDVDSCATCHPDVAMQWNASAHSFASFGNPIYRFNVERVRAELGKPASRHCAGCHDLPLLADGLMTAAAPIPADDLRSHSGVTCRLCHGVQATSHDGNGSYAWSAAAIDAPALGDAASIERHKQQVTTKVDTELCVGCHRGFLSPDMALPVHLSGIDEPGAWRGSAYTGNGTARVDFATNAASGGNGGNGGNIEQQTCIDCHMERVPAGAGELGAKRGTIASHRFTGGHTWMASMRGDSEQLRLTRAKLEGAASIDIAGVRVVAPANRIADATNGAADRHGPWHLPADGAPLVANTQVELDLVIRNLLVGHRFPGGVLDVQDTWIEVEVADRTGRRLAASGLRHAGDPDDTEAHVLRTLVVDARGNVLREHEIAQFRSQVATQTLAAREAQAIRYAFEVPKLAPAQLPLAVTARLRHRSRTLAMQAATCKSARSADGRAFLHGAKDARSVELDPCKPQPITLVASTRVELGAGARIPNTRPAWERMYEHGMALVASLITRVDEARVVLESALARTPDGPAGDRPRAMIETQLGWVAARQNRVDAALAHVKRARMLLAASPPVFDAIEADAYVRAHRWSEAIDPARRCAERAPKNAAVWAVYARVLVAAAKTEPEFATALDATARGLELSPRDPDLLRAQATALVGMRDPRAKAAQAAYARFRSPDEAPGLRIRCAHRSQSCARDRNPVHTLPLHSEPR